MGGETPIAREGLVSSYKNVCGECAGCMLPLFVCSVGDYGLRKLLISD